MQESVSTCVDCAITKALHSQTWTVIPSHRSTWWRLAMSASSVQKALFLQWTWSSTDKTNIPRQTPQSFIFQLSQAMMKISDVAPSFHRWDVHQINSHNVTHIQQLLTERDSYGSWCNWLLIDVVRGCTQLLPQCMAYIVMLRCDACFPRHAVCRVSAGGRRFTDGCNDSVLLLFYAWLFYDVLILQFLQFLNRMFISSCWITLPKASGMLLSFSEERNDISWHSFHNCWNSGTNMRSQRATVP